jgi:hypothetical protein
MPTRSPFTFLHRKREQIQVLGDSAAQKHAYLLTMDIFRDPGREMIEHLVHHWRILKASSYSRSESRISGRRSPDSLEDTERGDERMGAFVARLSESSRTDDVVFAAAFDGVFANVNKFTGDKQFKERGEIALEGGLS